MAKLLHPPGGPGYVNDGERVVAEALAAGLPENAFVVPNVEILQRTRVDEIDALVITDDVVVLVETKDLAGNVYFGENSMVVDGDERSEPYRLTDRKAKRVKSKIAARCPDLRHIRVESLVVLARRPRMLEIEPALRTRIVLVDDAVATILDPDGIARNAGSVTGQAKRIFDALRFQPRERKAAIGNYRILSRVEVTPDEEVFRAEHKVTGSEYLLRRIIFTGATKDDERLAKTKAATRAFQVAEAVDDSSRLAHSGDIFYADDGCLIVTTRLGAALPLAEWVDGRNPSTEERRSVLADVANGVGTLHRAGITHGRLSADTIEVSPNGIARVGALGAARMPTSSGATVVADELDPFFSAPETLDPTRVSAGTDLFALGRLIKWLWPDVESDDRPAPIGAPPSDLAAAMTTLVAPDPDERTPTAAELQLLAAGSPPGLPTKERELGRGVRINSFEIVGPIPGAPENVWAAFDRVMDTQCVLKTFDGQAGFESARNQFALLDTIDDDGVVKVRDVGTYGERAFLVTEFVEGSDLDADIHRGRRFDVDEVLALMLGTDLAGESGLLHSLEVLHSLPGGPAHADVKPANLILSPQGLVLVDFDLAVPPGSLKAAGSPAYLPPDVDFAGDPRDRDRFGAAMVMLRLLAGGDVGFDGLDELAHVSDPLRAFLGRALSSTLEERFESTTQMTAALVEAVRATSGWTLGELVVVPADRFAMENVPPMGKGDPIPRVEVDRFEVHLPGSRRLVIDVVETPDGSGWVVTKDAHGAGPILERLEQGLRLQVQVTNDGLRWAEIRQARPTPERGPDWSNLFKASLDELRAGAGVDLEEAISERAGGLLGTRDEVLGDSGPRRTFACATFPAGDSHGPLAAYLLSRVLPLMHGYSGGGPAEVAPGESATGGDMEPRAEKGSPEWAWEQYRPRYRARPETFNAYVDVWTHDPEARDAYPSWSMFSRCAGGEPAMRHRMEPARSIMQKNGYRIDEVSARGTRWWKDAN